MSEVFHQFKMKGQNIEQLANFLYQKEDIINEKIKNEEILETIKLFNQKYTKFKNINRFCIPVIGKCNSGKSTFLNYLLHQKEILETKDDISTKFICIIRHDPSLSYPKIFQANIVLRDTIVINDENGEKEFKDVYNFEEGDEIEINENIEKIIIEKNKELNQESNNIKDYFLIMRINIPLFTEPELSQYSNCFEFMDIPGLNESSYSDKECLYLQKLFPYFIYNIKFCLFIFDAGEYHSTDSKKVFNKTLSLLDNKEEICKNSLFIFNKIDITENKELAIQNFENYLKEILKTEKIDYISCSSKLLLLNSFKFQNYLSYLEYIFNEAPLNENIDPNNHIILKLKEDFDINVEENFDYEIKPDINQENEYKIFEEKMQNITSFNSILNINDYFYYKNYFKENANKKDIKTIELKIKNSILSSCKETINSYLDFEKFNNLMEIILSNLGIESEKIEDIKFNFKRRTIISLKNPPLQIFDSFKIIIEKLKNLKKHEFIEKITDECLFFENFLKKEIKIRIPAIGCYSSGKSSLINNIIGYNILPVSTEVSTNIGIIINYTNSIGDISLKKTCLKKSENYIEDYYYFKDSKEIIYSKLDFMKEVLSLMNNAFLYEDKVVDDIIIFIQKLEGIDYNFKNIINLINDILLYKKEDKLKDFENFYNSLKDYDDEKEFIREIYLKIKLYLDSIIESKKNKQRNKYLRNKQNKNEEDSFSFLKLSIPIHLFEEFEELKLTEEEKKQIEFIDFPGLNSENNIFDKSILTPLIKFSNGFLFVTKSSIKEGDTSEIISSTISRISNRKILDFSFDSFLFILTHCESLFQNINLEGKKKEINNAIFSSEIINNNILNQSDFLITNFSNIKYNNYLKDLFLSENIEKLYLYLKNNIKNISPNDSLKFAKKLRKDLNDSLINKLENKNDCKKYKPLNDGEFKGNKNKLLTKMKDNSLNNESSDIIDEFIIYYMFFINNIHKHQDYIKSNGPEFHKQFSKLIKNSKKSFDKTLEKSLQYFIIYLQDKLEKINMNFVLKKANDLINRKKSDEVIEKILILYKNSIDSKSKN